MKELNINRANIVETCGGCPSQFEAKTKDGESVYIRYRFGELTVRVGKDIDDAINTSPIFSKSVGDNLDGVMELAEVVKHVNQSDNLRLNITNE